jgi:hypothetical protein
MTATKLVSVKLPLKVFHAIPGAHGGRSRFIISALEEKLSRHRAAEWQPESARGRRLHALLAKGAAERGEPLDAAGLAAELRARRGGVQ